MSSALSRPLGDRQSHARLLFHSRRLLRLGTFLPLAALFAAVLFPVQAVHAQREAPGGLDAVAVSLPEDPGSAYPWEGSSGTGTNTGNGNKMTTLPVVGWTARGGLPVSLSLFHNSQGEGVSELGAKWSHSYDIYLVTDPATGTASVRWGNGIAYPFALNFKVVLFVKTRSGLVLRNFCFLSRCDLLCEINLRWRAVA